MAIMILIRFASEAILRRQRETSVTKIAHNSRVPPLLIITLFNYKSLSKRINKSAAAGPARRTCACAQVIAAPTMAFRASEMNQNSEQQR